MNINATLLVEMIIFAAFIGLSMRHIWPPLMATIAQRQREIITGVEKAEQAKTLLRQSEQQAEQIIHDAQRKSAALLDNAHQQVEHILAKGKEELVKQQEHALAQQTAALASARQKDQTQLANLTLQTAIQLAERFLGKQLTTAQHKALNQHMMDLADGQSHS